MIKRKALEAKIANVLKKRDDYIRDKKLLEGTGEKDSFDKAVKSTLKKQLSDK